MSRKARRRYTHRDPAGLKRLGKLDAERRARAKRAFISDHAEDTVYISMGIYSFVEPMVYDTASIHLRSGPAPPA